MEVVGEQKEVRQIQGNLDGYCPSHIPWNQVRWIFVIALTGRVPLIKATHHANSDESTAEVVEYYNNLEDMLGESRIIVSSASMMEEKRSWFRISLLDKAE